MNSLVKKELTLNSREVAEMVGKRHANLIRDIKTYPEYMERVGLIEDALRVADKMLNRVM